MFSTQFNKFSIFCVDVFKKKSTADLLYVEKDLCLHLIDLEMREIADVEQKYIKQQHQVKQFSHNYA